MFGLRLVAFSLAALLCGTINVALAVGPPWSPPYTPWPPPYTCDSPPLYHFSPGEIVSVASSHTSGSIGASNSNIQHPHIVLGHDPHTGVILAPITHNTNSDHFRPFMPAPAGSGLGGGIRLDPIVAHPHSISRPHGPLRGKIVPPHEVANIQSAISLVQAHRNAAREHSLAAQAHRHQEKFYNEQSAYRFRAGNTLATMHDRNQAAAHTSYTQQHEAAAADLHWAANAVNGPGPNAQHHAQQSANYAHAAYQPSNAAARHDQTYLVQAHRNAAHEHYLAAQAHRYHENFHDQQSAYHFRTGNALAGTYHSNQAAIHAGHGQKHEAAAANHHSAANAINGPDANAQRHARESTNRAHAVHQSFYTAARLDQSALALAQQGNYRGVQYYSGVAHNARQSANQFSTASIYSHNHATGAHLRRISSRYLI